MRGVTGCGGGGGKKHKRLIYFRPGNPSRTHNVSYATCVFTCHHDTEGKNSGVLGGGDELERKIDGRNQWTRQLFLVWTRFTGPQRACVRACVFQRDNAGAAVVNPSHPVHFLSTADPSVPAEKKKHRHVSWRCGRGGRTDGRTDERVQWGVGGG